MRPWGVSGLLVASSLLAGCIVEAPTGPSSSTPATSPQASAPVRVPPALSLRSGANFEGKVELLGGTVQPSQILPGEPARVALYFRVLDELKIDYTIFVHLEDAEGRGERMNLDHPPQGGLLPTSRWKKGQVIKDEFALVLPAGAPLRAIRLWLGFWDPKTDTRLKLTNPQIVPNDGNNRILFAQVAVGR